MAKPAGVFLMNYKAVITCINGHKLDYPLYRIDNLNFKYRDRYFNAGDFSWSPKLDYATNLRAFWDFVFCYHMERIDKDIKMESYRQGKTCEQQLDEFFKFLDEM